MCVRLLHGGDVVRIIVACINWTHSDAPHAMSYVLRDGEAVATAYHATWTDAMQRADKLREVIRRAVTS